jgi:hypothetical protein
MRPPWPEQGRCLADAIYIEPDHNPGVADPPGVMAEAELWGQLAPRAERQPG